MILRFANVAGLDQWLDRNVGIEYIGSPLAQNWARIAKMNEEVGEAIAALIGWTGQNPRKGFTHNRDDVLAEVADVVFTGILAIQHFTKDEMHTIEILQERWNYRTQKWQEAIHER